MKANIKPKKPQLVASYRDKLSKKYSSVNRRGEPSFMEVMFSMAILVGIIALIWYLL